MQVGQVDRINPTQQLSPDSDGRLISKSKSDDEKSFDSILKTKPEKSDDELKSDSNNLEALLKSQAGVHLDLSLKQPDNLNDKKNYTASLGVEKNVSEKNQNQEVLTPKVLGEIKNNSELGREELNKTLQVLHQLQKIQLNDLPNEKSKEINLENFDEISKVKIPNSDGELKKLDHSIIEGKKNLGNDKLHLVSQQSNENHELNAQGGKAGPIAGSFSVGESISNISLPQGAEIESVSVSGNVPVLTKSESKEKLGLSPKINSKSGVLTDSIDSLSSRDFLDTKSEVSSARNSQEKVQIPLVSERNQEQSGLFSQDKFDPKMLKNASLAAGSNVTAFPMGRVEKSLPSEVTGYVVKGAMAMDRLSTQALKDLGDSLQGVSQKNGGEIRLKLNPVELGELKLKISTHGNQVNIQVQASDNQAKNILEDSLMYLKENLASHKLNLGKVDFSVLQSNSLDHQATDTQNFFGRGESSQRHFSQGDSWGGSQQSQREWDQPYNQNATRRINQQPLRQGSIEDGRLNIIA